jgi:hypothetical protein
MFDHTLKHTVRNERNIIASKSDVDTARSISGIYVGKFVNAHLHRQSVQAEHKIQVPEHRFTKCSDKGIAHE